MFHDVHCSFVFLLQFEISTHLIDGRFLFFLSFCSDRLSKSPLASWLTSHHNNIDILQEKKKTVSKLLRCCCVVVVIEGFMGRKEEGDEKRRGRKKTFDGRTFLTESLT